MSASDDLDLEFDHVIQVHADGSVTAAPSDVHAPELWDEQLQGDGWEFFTHGYSGQYGYSGPIMHNSEFVGARLARDILAQPGYYVAVVAYWTPEDDDDEPDFLIEGWAVAHRAVSA